jgi:hypothetical protein
MNFEVPRADRRDDSRRLAAGLRQGARDLRLTGSEEAKDAMVGRRRLLDDVPDSLGLERAWPQALELRGRAGQDDHRRFTRPENEARRGASHAERHRALRQCRLLAHALLEIAIRPPQPCGDGARDHLDLHPELLVDVQRQTRGAGDQLDGAVVVRRPEPAGHDAEISLQPDVERGLELVLVVANDRDRRRLQAEPHELAREERPVAVRAVASNELATGDDESATQTGRCRAV